MDAAIRKGRRQGGGGRRYSPLFHRLGRAFHRVKSASFETPPLGEHSNDELTPAMAEMIGS
jgi:hypothetical protein